MNAIVRAARGENAIDFGTWWKRGLVLSAILVTLSIVSLFTRGLNLGIDFEGGTSWEVSAPGVSVSDAREELGSVGEGQAKIQIVGSDILRVQVGTSDPEIQSQVRETLAELAAVDAGEVSVSTVGPSWGDEITRSAERALVIFLIVMLIYLSIRLEWQMAVGTVVAMVHDVIISVGVYSIFQFEVTPGTVIAFLTILGYSIYDTIVVFDKVKENEGRVGVASRMTYTDMVSLSMNQVLLRSINTTVVALLPVLSILFVGSFLLGAVTLQEFGLALFVGMAAGAYSSIFVAAPIATALRERDSRYRSIRERVTSARATGSSAVTHGPQGASVSSPKTVTPEGGSTPPAETPMTTAIPPRPRKKSKGKRR
jgi:preprotein translocase subunit SecF